MAGNAWAVSEVRIGKKFDHGFVSCLDGLLSFVAGIGDLVWLECIGSVGRNSCLFFFCGKMYGCRPVFDNASVVFYSVLFGAVCFGIACVLG